jgi:Ni/Co efflux regulator RcnB
MKKFIASLIAVSMIATPVLARDRGRYDRSYERHERHHRGIRTGEAVAIGLGALILGAAIAKNNRREREVIYQDYRTQVCQDIIKYDYYGNPYVVGRNCWYQ